MWFWISYWMLCKKNLSDHYSQDVPSWKGVYCTLLVTCKYVWKNWVTLDAIALINARHANRYLILESLTWDHDSLGITINERQVSKGDDEVKKGMTLVSRKDIKKRRSTLHPDVLASGLEIGRCTIDYSFRSLILADDHHRHHLGDHHEKIRKRRSGNWLPSSLRVWLKLARRFWAGKRAQDEEKRSSRLILILLVVLNNLFCWIEFIASRMRTLLDSSRKERLIHVKEG